MPKFDDFDLDIQSIIVNDASPENKANSYVAGSCTVTQNTCNTCCNSYPAVSCGVKR